MRQPDILAEIYAAAVIEGVSLNDLRRTYGGQRVWLRETPEGASEKRKQERVRIIEELRSHPPEVVARRHGIHRATAYRLAKLG